MNTKGFTLIELLIAIAIIALLSGIVLTNFNPARAKSRDAKRISDLSHIQTALELAFDRCRVYPAALDPNAAICTKTVGGVSTPITLSLYLPVIPTSPAPGTYSYNVNSAHTDYVLQTNLEAYNEVLKDGLKESTKPSWETVLICREAETPSDQDYTSYCIGPK